MATLTGEQFEKGSSWNITDLAISFSTYSMLYIYIIDNDLGTVIVDLKSIIETTEPFNYYGKVSGAKNVINTGSEICFVFENFIEIYGYSLEYWKTILTNIYEPIVGTYGKSNMIYLITSSALYIFDSGQPSHNSLFYTLPISNQSLLSFGLFNWGDMRIANFNPDKHYVEIYTSSCPNKEFDVGCSFYYQFYMNISNSEYLRDFSLQTSISIAAFNKENLLKETFPINLIINGNFPCYKEENWENHKNIPYNERYELDLSKFFEGQNIVMALSVNGNYSFNETVDNWPAIIPQRTELLRRYDLNKHYGKTNHIIIPNTEIAVILSFSELFIIDATMLTNKVMVLNLTEISNITDLICNFMDVFPHTQNNLALLITSCIYRIPEAIEYKNTTTYISEIAYAIILWELDYVNFEVIKYRPLNTYSDHNYLKVAPLDAHSFEILAFYIDNSAQNYINSIYRYNGRWEINDISISQCEVINYFSLGLNSFYALLAEFIVKDSETVYWYIIDNQYGIRIIQTSKNSTSILVGGLYIELNYYFVNFGLWGDTLYIACGEWMKSFKLRSYTSLEEDSNYGAYEFQESDYLFLLNNIVSSKDNRYIACPVWRNDLGLLIRIWDAKAKNSSNIISEIYASEIYTLLYPVSMQFIGNSILKFSESR
ncbi:unnamed protein product [Blepharisma stoltei]|uniref:Uncharacterized protein n=1 Tax=Blepharisma stoltei TaxID=1481888 RepID=A0AAU9II04_9CILI|nr:unnamed protein product [Blepharisma stoltei]